MCSPDTAAEGHSTDCTKDDGCGSLQPPSTPAKQTISSGASTTGTIYRGTKRQRLDAATSVLKRPFKSPLLVKRDGEAGSTAASMPSALIQTPRKNTISGTRSGNFHSTFRQPSLSTASIGTSQSIYSSNLSPSPSPLTKQSNPAFRASKTKSLLRTFDPELQALLSQNISLKSQLKVAKAHLAISQQALLLESLLSSHKNSDQHLEELITKWTNVAREAAEFLYGVAVDKVNRMGGPAVWFERERKRKQSGWGDDPEPEQEQEQDDNHDYDIKRYAELEKRDLYAEYGIDPAKNMKKTNPSILEQESGDSQAFTMEIFLRFLSVDLDKIGWDTQSQCWKN